MSKATSASTRNGGRPAPVRPISRHVFPTQPPSVEYRLTEMGKSLLDPLAALVRWADTYYGAIRGARSEYDRQAA